MTVETRAQTLKRMRKDYVSAETQVFGPRGSLDQAAKATHSILAGLPLLLEPEQPEAFIESALCYGRWGGEPHADMLGNLLIDSLKPESALNKECRSALILALSMIGGPEAVNALFAVTEYKSESISIQALSGLEYLATDGATSLIEHNEPATINSEPQAQVFSTVWQRLVRLSQSETAPAYTRLKAAELAETIDLSLTNWYTPTPMSAFTP